MGWVVNPMPRPPAGKRPGRQRLKCDGTCAETRFRLSAKGTSPFESAGVSVHSNTGRRAVHISLQGLYCSCKPVFCSHVTLTGYPLYSIVSPSLLLPCIIVCHHISNTVYQFKEAGRAPVPVWTGGKNLTPIPSPEFDLWTVQSVAHDGIL
jgi:hypothetical protein